VVIVRFFCAGHTLQQTRSAVGVFVYLRPGHYCSCLLFAVNDCRNDAVSLKRMAEGKDMVAYVGYIYGTCCVLHGTGASLHPLGTPGMARSTLGSCTAFSFLHLYAASRYDIGRLTARQPYPPASCVYRQFCHIASTGLYISFIANTCSPPQNIPFFYRRNGLDGGIMTRGDLAAALSAARHAIFIST